MKLKTLVPLGVAIVSIVFLLNFNLKNLNEIVPKQEGKPVQAEVIEKNFRNDTKVGKVHEVTLKVGEKTYNTLIKEELYSKVEKGTKLEVLQYKDRIVLYDSYDLAK
ncbi:hypothetical protein ACQUY5_25120 [Bacillus cereus]|uniref:hypothetical protein n=1 Tax=Bacillus cereus TaxID=1396 RepID=UPI003D184FA7